MKTLDAIAVGLTLTGVLYASYWSLAYGQVQELRTKEWESLTKPQFVEAHPNVYRALRFFDYDPYADYSGMCVHPGAFVPRHMLRHAWGGIAVACLGIVIGTFRSAHLAWRIAHYLAVVGFGAAGTVTAFLHPAVWWFWTAKQIVWPG
jgi:hypothetical protein